MRFDTHQEERFNYNFNLEEAPFLYKTFLSFVILISVPKAGPSYLLLIKLGCFLTMKKDKGKIPYQME